MFLVIARVAKFCFVVLAFSDRKGPTYPKIKANFSVDSISLFFFEPDPVLKKTEREPRFPRVYPEMGGEV